MIRLILQYADVNRAYSFVFSQTKIGIPELLEIPTLAYKGYHTASDRLFSDTLTKLNAKVE